MSNQRPRTVFFGSGPVAAACLELLLEWCDVEAVITKPQPAHHREAFPVITVAERHSLTVLTASNRRELDSLLADGAFEHFTSQAALLIDYGIIVSQPVIDHFPLGIINAHFSLLPEWRGADPISFAILSGQAETGISLMLLVQAMDEGPLLAQAPLQLSNTMTTARLTNELVDLSDASLRHILPAYIDGHVEPAPQLAVARPGHDAVSYSRKLSKADSQLDFLKPASQLEREIRAFHEWPKSRTSLAGKDVVVLAARADDMAIAPDQPAKAAGQAYADADAIAIVCTPGILYVTELKPAGKGAMGAKAFLAGNRLRP